MRKATEDPLVQEISKRLITVRHYKKLTKEQMADLIGVSVSRYEKMELGQSRIGLDHMYKIMGDDPWICFNYMGTGKHSKDINFEQGFSKMPQDQLMSLMQKYGITADTWDKFDYRTIMEFFSEVAQYGEEHVHDEKLRDAPSVTVFTDTFEAMANQASEE